jgi:hypothetical protein
LIEGSSTAIQPARRSTIGTVTGRSLIDDGRTARGVPPGVSKTARPVVSRKPSVTAAVDSGVGSAGRPRGACE